MTKTQYVVRHNCIVISILFSIIQRFNRAKQITETVIGTEELTQHSVKSAAITGNQSLLLIPKLWKVMTT